MAQINAKSSSALEIKIHLLLSEDEASAMMDIAGYGANAFLEVFKEKLGRHYIEQPGHEAGLRSLFDTIRQELPQHFHRIQTARKAVAEILNPKKTHQHDTRTTK